MPMSRGIFESIYVKLADGVTAADLKAALAKKYVKGCCCCCCCCYARSHAAAAVAPPTTTPLRYCF